MTSTETDGGLLLFSQDEDEAILEEVKDGIGYESLSLDWDNFGVPVDTPMHEHQLSGLEAMVDAGDCGPAAEKQVSVQPVPNSMPVVDGWLGEHYFQATVRPRPTAVAGRQLPYVYSAAAEKLYTDLMVAVPFSFTYSNVSDPAALRIRALPVYKESHHVQTPVRRCAIHREAGHPSNAGGQHPMLHVIRAEHPRASYHEEQERCSVTVPLEAPEPGTDDYQVLFKFTCMNTCVGGINRRRLMMVFTLEDRSSGRTLGRQAVEVKVCRCPHRDWRADEKRLGTDQPAKQSKRRREASPSPPRPSPAANATGQLWVPADDPAMYRCLMETRESLLRYRRAVAPQPPAATQQQPQQPQQHQVALSRQDTAPVKAELM